MTKKRCPRCNVPLRKGIALVNTVYWGAPDFFGSTDITGQTFSFTGPAKMIGVWKCPECGYSRSIEPLASVHPELKLP